MAESLVFAVLQKIATVIGAEVVKAGTSKCCQEVSKLREVQYNIKHIQREFEVMRGFLRKEDVQTSNDPGFQSWLEQVRKVAFDVEDIIDEYAYLVGQQRSIKSVAKRTIQYVKKSRRWHELATKLKEVKGDLEQLTQMRQRYGIIIPDGSRSNGSNGNTLFNMSDCSYHLVDENEIVEKIDERNQVVGWLTNTHKGRAIISIWGMGGLGKTTLVSGVCKSRDVNENFECCAFISVSQSFQVEDLLRSTLKQILEEGKSTTEFDLMDRTNLEQIIRNKLQNKKYLIVLDDMWQKTAWLSISQAFPKNTKGSRVVITTRMQDVASLADKNWSIKMRALSKEEARKLFNTKAFGKLTEKTCPQQLVEWAEKIVDKCQGLPLAIVAIGSLLSFKGVNETRWRLFYKQLSGGLSNNPELNWVASVLNLSYDDLPTHLKNCFLYCSLLPEDFLIPRKWIIRLMVAEGFIEDRGTHITVEEVAESYLVELAQRSLLQVVEKNVNGRAKRFKMHDLVRDMCISKAKAESFGIGCDNQLFSFDGKARRIFVPDMTNCLQQVIQSSKLRSFILFRPRFSSAVIESALANLRLLRVLCLHHSNIEHVPNLVFQLFNLHYLDVSNTKVKVIPKSVGKLKLLETLDIRFTFVTRLPSEITNLRKLRHLFVVSYNVNRSRESDSFRGVSVPSSICGFQDIKTLRWIQANDVLILELRNLVKLRNLFLTNVKANHIGDLWISIAKFPFLSTLGIVASNNNEVLNLHGLNFPPRLEKLHLKGKLEGGVIPQVFSSLSKLRDLRLGWSGLREDPLNSLSHMSNLVKLFFLGNYEGPTMTFHSGWFPKLQVLYLRDLFELHWIVFEDGTMGNLKTLRLTSLSKLTNVPEGMRFLCTLNKLILRDMPDKFMSNLEEHQWKSLCSISIIL